MLLQLNYSASSQPIPVLINSEEFVRYHEMIHHINSLKNDPQDDIDENNFELENESK